MGFVPAAENASHAGFGGLKSATDIDAPFILKTLIKTSQDYRA
ncbi:hypothetical protein [Aquirhabdus parva]|nr:hypothetical protein [Aquirhabdus parva]